MTTGITNITYLLAILLALLLSLCSTAFAAVNTTTPTPHSTAIDPHKDKIHTHLLIVVLSYAGDDRRNSLRETWLAHDTNKTKWVFLMGNADHAPNKAELYKEEKKYGDMLFMHDVMDDYAHLSDKVLKGFTEVYKRYKFDFLLKADSDTFVHIPKLTAYLQNQSTHATYIGYLAFTKDNTELWGFLSGVYYMLGGGYLLTYDIVAYFAHSQHLMIRAPSEDVTVGIHMHGINAKWLRNPDTVFRTSAGEICSCEQSVIVNHKCKRSDIYYMYYSLKQTNNPCLFKENATFARELVAKYKFPIDDVKPDIRW